MTIGFKLLKLRNISPRRIFTYMMIFSALCLLLPRGLTDKLDHAFSQLIGPITRQSRDITLEVTKPVRQSHSPAVSPLEHEVNNLRQRVRRLEEEKKQWAGLHENFDQAPIRIILANIVSGDSVAWSQGKLLDRGSNDHLRKGQFVLGVLDTDGSLGQIKNPDHLTRCCVIGRIKETRGSHNSTLQTLTDANFQIPVFVEPRWNREEAWRADGILMGDGKGGIEVKMIRADFSVKVGDPIMACPHPEYLPVAMVAGIVKSCTRDQKNAMFWHIIVEPAADLNSLQQVAVLSLRWTQE